MLCLEDVKGAPQGAGQGSGDSGPTRSGHGIKFPQKALQNVVAAWPHHTLIKEAERGNNSQNGAFWGLRHKAEIRFSWMVWLIFDAQWHIGRFWFVTTRLDTCCGSQLFMWWDLFITEAVEEMRGLHGNHIRGVAEEQQEGVTGFYRLEGAAKIPNTEKAPLYVRTPAGFVMRVENCQLHFSKRLSTEKAEDAVISFKYLLSLLFWPILPSSSTFRP